MTIQLVFQNPVTIVEDDESKGLHIECIFKNKAFWLECISKPKQFFKTCILPEILGKYYTQPNPNLTQVTDNEQPSISDTDTQKLNTSSNSSETSTTGDASGTSSKSTSSNMDDTSGTCSKSRVVKHLIQNSVLVTQVVFLMMKNQHTATVMDLTKAR